MIPYLHRRKIQLVYWLKYKLFPFHCCQLCGLPTRHILCQYCTSYIGSFECQHSHNIQHRDVINGEYFCYTYNFLLREIIGRYKYKKDINLKWPLGYLISLHLKSITWDVDFIIPVPSHKNKIKKRGFDHISSLLDYYIATNNKIPVKMDILKKLKDGNPQVGLNRHDRQVNLHNTFVVKKDINNKNILIFDDVYTTGSTMNEIATLLKSCGAGNIYMLCLCRTHNP